MNPDSLEQEIRELAWRHPLNSEERARLDRWLAAHPEALLDWEADAALSAALKQLPDEPAPSNLTARVLAAIDRKEVVPSFVPKADWLHGAGSLGWVPRLAVVVAVLAGGLFWYQHQQQARLAAEQAEALTRLADVAEVSSLPSPEALENFEIILRLSPVPLADMDLLSMSKELAALNP